MNNDPDHRINCYICRNIYCTCPPSEIDHADLAALNHSKYRRAQTYDKPWLQNSKPSAPVSARRSFLTVGDSTLDTSSVSSISSAVRNDHRATPKPKVSQSGSAAGATNKSGRSSSASRVGKSSTDRLSSSSSSAANPATINNTSRPSASLDRSNSAAEKFHRANTSRPPLPLSPPPNPQFVSLSSITGNKPPSANTVSNSQNSPPPKAKPNVVVPSTSISSDPKSTNRSSTTPTKRTSSTSSARGGAPVTTSRASSASPNHRSSSSSSSSATSKPTKTATRVRSPSPATVKSAHRKSTSSREVLVTIDFEESARSLIVSTEREAFANVRLRWRSSIKEIEREREFREQIKSAETSRAAQLIQQSELHFRAVCQDLQIETRRELLDWYRSESKSLKKKETQLAQQKRLNEQQREMMSVMTEKRQSAVTTVRDDEPDESFSSSNVRLASSSSSSTPVSSAARNRQTNGVVTNQQQQHQHRERRSCSPPPPLPMTKNNDRKTISSPILDLTPPSSPISLHSSVNKTTTPNDRNSTDRQRAAGTSPVAKFGSPASASAETKRQILPPLSPSNYENNARNDSIHGNAKSKVRSDRSDDELSFSLSDTEEEEIPRQPNSLEGATKICSQKGEKDSPSLSKASAPATAAQQQQHNRRLDPSEILSPEAAGNKSNDVSSIFPPKENDDDEKEATRNAGKTLRQNNNNEEKGGERRDRSSSQSRRRSSSEKRRSPSSSSSKRRRHSQLDENEKNVEPMKLPSPDDSERAISSESNSDNNNVGTDTKNATKQVGDADSRTHASDADDSEQNDEKNESLPPILNPRAGWQQVLWTSGNTAANAVVNVAKVPFWCLKGVMGISAKPATMVNLDSSDSELDEDEEQREIQKRFRAKRTFDPNAKNEGGSSVAVGGSTLIPVSMMDEGNNDEQHAVCGQV